MSSIKLGTLKKGSKGRIVSVGRETQDLELVRRLMEMGLLAGARYELVHEAPFGKDPIAVKVRGAMLALRRQEANQIEVIQDE